MRNKGFTLVEVMIVVAILAILASLLIPNLVRVRVDANDSAAQAALKTISTSLENYFVNNNQYPATTTALIGLSPPYLNKDYFAGVHDGFTYTANLTNYTYSVIAVPTDSNHGNYSYTITTGGVLTRN